MAPCGMSLVRGKVAPTPSETFAADVGPIITVHTRVHVMPLLIGDALVAYSADTSSCTLEVCVT